MDEPYSTRPARPDEPSGEATPKKSSSGKGKKWLKGIFFALLFAALGAAGGYYYADMKAQDELDAKVQEVADLKVEKAKLEKDLADAKEASKKTTTVVSAEVSQEQIDNMIDAVGSGNYAALEDYLANPVKVIIAASEGLGDRTPMQALTDLKYLDDSGTWNFDLPAATLAAYRAGDYKQYFPTKAIIGKSSEGKVVAFGFNSEAKINLIFLAANEDLLK